MNLTVEQIKELVESASEAMMMDINIVYFDDAYLDVESETWFLDGTDDYVGWRVTFNVQDGSAPVWAAVMLNKEYEGWMEAPVSDELFKRVSSHCTAFLYLVYGYDETGQIPNPAHVNIENGAN